jgi:signal transduction histidine kinase
LRRKGLFYCSLLGILLSGILLILYFLLPALVSPKNSQKSLKSLRNQAQTIKNEFSRVLNALNQKQKILASSSFPQNKEAIFNLFKRIDLHPEIEGIAYYDSKGNLTLWIGNMIDLGLLFDTKEEENAILGQESSFLINHKASSYLVRCLRLNRSEHIVLFRLLAFSPQFKAAYLEDYQFLKPKLLRNCDVDYWDFREDVSGFEKIFSRHNDEYLGQPRQQNEIQTIYFPLRNEGRKIIATVTLSSPSSTSKVSTLKENLLIVFYLVLCFSLILLLLSAALSGSFFKEKKWGAAFLIILILIGLRFIFVLLNSLGKIQSLLIFSPSTAGFFSFLNLTKSPADIFLSSLVLFLILWSIAYCSQSLIPKKKRHSSWVLSLTLDLISVFISLFLVYAFQKFLSLLILHSNFSFLRFSFSFSFLLLHLSVLLTFLSFAIATYTGFKIASATSIHRSVPFFILLLASVVFFLLSKERNLLLFIFLVGMVALILSLTFFPEIWKRKESFFVTFFLSTLFIFFSLNHYSSYRTRSLLQNLLKNTIVSQEHWGNLLVKESLPEIENLKSALLSYFQHPDSPDLAHFIWEKTLVAKFNWYSSFEVLNPEGELLSRFSLNVPKLSPQEMKLPLSPDWTVLRQKIPFIGKEKDFIVSYKDWFEGEKYLGRTILYFSMDFELLPFLYSANPYFELLRINPLPSLHQFNFGFAIFDLNGKLLFNPHKISSGITPHLLALNSKNSTWSVFKDKNKRYLSFYFQWNNRIYSFFTPQKNFIQYSVEYIKLLFLYLFFFSICVLLFTVSPPKKKIKNPFWSFSNRVYASFIAIAIIPLILFTFFTESFFDRLFSQKFIEQAEAQASVARRIMEDFIFLQQEETTSLTALPEDLVLWISSTISNDINLYRAGKLISSSRREFFDSGLLPELIDGEIYFNLQYENKPFYTQRQKIGDYSFQTLTIPFSYLDSLFLISLPFPFERQEIAKSTQELIESLIFISVFFIALVLLFARAIGTMIVTPITKLLEGTKEVSLGNLEIRLEHKPHDEMKTLIDGFNAMIQSLKEHQQELAEMSKKVAWAEMARKVAHEVKNPLTPIQLSAEHLLKVYEDKKGDFEKALKESTAYIISEVENLRKIAQEFLEISKETTLKREYFDLRTVIQETLAPYERILAERIKFKEIYVGTNFDCTGDKSKIKIVLRNILINAIEAIRGKGEIELKTCKEANTLILEICDTGIGMEKDILEKIFEPYFSTKAAGTGLGLPITKKIIEDHGGTIQISSEPKKGTKVTIKLPCER